jgi:hypothetical protein
VILTEDGAGAVITGYTGSIAAVKIPATIQGMPVREIGGSLILHGVYKGAFEDNQTITSVVIPEGVIKIGDRSFGHGSWGRSNSKLTQVTLPSTLQIIGEGAFDSNKLLRAIVIPKEVTKIGDWAFSSCSSLASVTLPESLRYLGAGAFQKTAIASITLPPNLSWIADGTFRECKKLVSVVIPEGVTQIYGGEYGGAFIRCIALTSVILPSTIQKIGNGAFKDCSALTTVTIPDTVETIEFGNNRDQFGGCSKVALASQARLKKLGYTGSF